MDFSVQLRREKKLVLDFLCEADHRPLMPLTYPPTSVHPPSTGLDLTNKQAMRCAGSDALGVLSNAGLKQSS